MARDYKTRANPKPKKQQTSGWIWFFVGLLVGLFAAGLIWLKFGQQPGTQVTTPKAAVQAPIQQQKKTKKETKTERSLPPKPRFDFYTILPEMEVVVPEPEPAPTKQIHKKPTNPAPVATRSAYMLQMGSFRKYGDADRRKARLALLGIQAEIQKVTINNKDTYHRVRSGPYRSSQQVNKIRAQLQQNKISTLLIKLKK